MPPQASPKGAESNSKFDSVSDGIMSSIADLTSSTTNSKPNQRAEDPTGPKYYPPPKGSQNIPHPRTIPDILFRSIFIQLCAGLAYYLFLQTLRQALRRKGLRIADFPGPWWIWPLLSVLLPELILVQVGIWLFSGLFPFLADLLGIGSLGRLQPSKSKRTAASDNIWFVVLQAIALIIPLYYAAKGYKERLAMRYHEANYVGNLGIDHRDGWAAFSGLICGLATILFLGLQLFRGHRSLEEPVARHSGSLTRLDDITEEDEEWDWEEKDNLVESSTSKRKDSNESPCRPNNDPVMASTSAKYSASTRNSLSALFFDAEVVLALALASIIHQIPLAATNRRAPIKAALTTRWSLCLVPIVMLSVLALPHTQRLALRQALLSRDSSNRMPIFLTFMRTVTVILLWSLIGSTILVQAWTDYSELNAVGHGILQPWNYRWRVKDVFSHGDSDKVYMG